MSEADAPAYGVGHRQRLRERLLNGGADAFHDHELLEYILGLCIPRRDTKPLAKRLIETFGSYSSVVAAEPDVLMASGVSEAAVAGIKFIEASAVRMLQAAVHKQPVLSSWQSLLDYLHADMAHGIRERFRVLFLNGRGMIMRDDVMSHGTVSHTAVYVREIMKRALDIGATGLILVHNHPSGDPAPSQDDISLTKEIIETARRLGITVHDHVIVGKSGFKSFKALGLM
ncbi:RadC family protein [Pedomonas mirosovicensis]|uniref:RadC family protein n=1 Tax=Pedomonas mirosovicensis TaxID=2908641 RepID=UPI0021681808|nr:DNA repair protein RadC [Pedomonas mirosovicensis]MCH8685801.1 DNA repair protein RadC [Pedomonas mirosovicensis]